ncbi:MAG TPA: 2Fe-2S iron-sulfur cluster-binding protein [Anaeromyxobacteraceae bacterium]|jgi:sarcosine oxidase subunit alpha|nr:2Fe-2S iron-sulfur cluster-binding protein [Anaeromyxobacteraceae bacterium]
MGRLAEERFASDCTILVDGHPIPARAGERVTSALLAAGQPLLSRSAKYHRPRGPFCLAGSCSSCLVRVDGVPNVRACQTPCREGLRVETQNAVGGAAHDLLGAIDWLAPHGIDHHKVATWNQLVNRVAVSASRKLAGLGLLPDEVPAPWPEASDERFEALVVGSGPAGLGAAEALARAGKKVFLAEREPALGGRLRCRLDLAEDPPLEWAGEVAEAVRRAGGEVARGAAVIGLWPGEGEATAAVVQAGEPPRMRRVRAARVVLASGSWIQRPVFERNDVPGIHAARSLAVMLAEDGVLPGERLAVLGRGPEAEAVAARFAAAGLAVERLDGEIATARGRNRLSGLDLADGRRVPCDALAVATARMPAAELARSVGAPLELDPETGAFRVRPGAGGAVAPGIHAAGEVTGPCSAAEAARAGREAGEAAARG